MENKTKRSKSKFDPVTFLIKALSEIKKLHEIKSSAMYYEGRMEIEKCIIKIEEKLFDPMAEHIDRDYVKHLAKLIDGMNTSGTILPELFKEVALMRGWL